MFSISYGIHSIITFICLLANLENSCSKIQIGKLEGFSQNTRVWLKNNWANTRSVCTCLECFFHMIWTICEGEK